MLRLVGPNEEPFIGQFYNIFHCTVANKIWIKITRLTIHNLHVCIYFLVYDVEILTNTAQTNDNGKELGQGEKLKRKMFHVSLIGTSCIVINECMWLSHGRRSLGSLGNVLMLLHI